MKKIPSFTIDHTRLQRGIYVSRRDVTPSGDVVTTFDIRMKLPNREPAVSQSALHTIEHLAATFLRNHSEWASRIIYWGPMGCCTGNYLLVQGDLTSADIAPLVTETFRFIANYMRAKFRVPMSTIVAITCSITCPWHAGKPENTLLRCWRTSRCKICIILIQSRNKMPRFIHQNTALVTTVFT